MAPAICDGVSSTTRRSCATLTGSSDAKISASMATSEISASMRDFPRIVAGCGLAALTRLACAGRLGREPHADRPLRQPAPVGVLIDLHHLDTRELEHRE